MNQVKNILYLGWLGKGNVGDEVLFELFKLMFYKNHQTKNKDIVVNIDALSVINNYKTDVSNYDLIVLGGGSLIQSPYFLNICKEGIKKGIPVVSWGTGVDGPYKLEDLNSIYISGKNAEEIVSIYEGFDYISVRGPFTKNILVNSGLRNDVHEIGDPALSYSREMFEDKLENNIENKNILINWGTSYNNIFGGNELAVENELVTVIKELLSQDYRVTVYPIWTEDIDPVKRLVQKVNDNKCQIITEVYEAKVLQRFISEAYLTINLKLHANILSAATNCPFISLAYRGKCYDFAQTVECSEYVLSTDLVTAEIILDMVNDIESKYDSIVERFKEARIKYYPKLLDSISKISTILNEQVSKKIEATSNGLINNSTFKHKCLNVLEDINHSIEKCKGKLEESSLLNIINQNNDLSREYLETLSTIIKSYIKGKIPDNVFDFYLEKQYSIEKDRIISILNNLKMVSEKTFDDTTSNRLFNSLDYPKVSVIITTYNRKAFLKESITSIQKQDYPNIEIIVVDDNSIDNTNKMMKSLSMEEPSITYIRNEINCGPSKSRQNAFNSYANGDYVLFLDDDDYLIDTNYIAKAINFHINHPDVSFVAANVFYEFTKTNQFKPSFLNLEGVVNSGLYFLNFKKTGYPKPISTLTTIFKRSSLVKMGVSDMQMVNDESLYLRSLLVGNAGFINEIVGVYRVHGNNITFNLRRDFIFDNLEEKMAIKNISINQYGYDREKMNSWMEHIAYNTISYYLSNSAKDIYDIKQMYLWANQNCPSIIKQLAFKRTGIKLPTEDPYIKRIIQMSFELTETILEGLDYINNLLNEEKLEQSIFMMNNIFEAFESVKGSINPIIKKLVDSTVQEQLVSLEGTLEQIVKAYDEYKVTTIQEIIQSSFTQQFNELRNEFEFYLLIS